MNFKNVGALYDEIDTSHKLFFDIFLNFPRMMMKVLKSVCTELIEMFATRGEQVVKSMGTVVYKHRQAQKMRVLTHTATVLPHMPGTA